MMTTNLNAVILRLANRSPLGCGLPVLFDELHHVGQHKENRLRSIILTAAIIASNSGIAQPILDVRGTAPYQTSLDGNPYPEYGQIYFRCDTGQCTIQKATVLCDRPASTLSQAVVNSDRITVVQKPTVVSPVLGLKIEDFGTDYSCSINLKPSTNPVGTWHIENYVCTYLSPWHGGKRKSERSVPSVAITKVCPGLKFERSQW